MSGYRDPEALRTRIRRLIPWRVHGVLPHVLWRQRVGPFIERGRRGWSRWDVMALGADQSILPALGEVMIHLGVESASFPGIPPFEDDDGAEAWSAELIRHGQALVALREEPEDYELAQANFDAARAALEFVAAWHRSLWD